MWAHAMGLQSFQITRLQEVPVGPQNAFLNHVMATCDHPSDLARGIAYSSLARPELRINWRLPALPAEEEELTSASSEPQAAGAGDLFGESLIASGKSRRRNPWATAGALAFQLILLAALVVIPLFHIDPLPKKESLTMLYLQPPAAPVGSPTRFQAPKRASTYTPTSTGITAPVHKTQEAPPPAGTTGGILGGVPGGVVGGAPGGAFDAMLNSAPSAPILEKSPAPAPANRMRIAARVAEANLIHDVAPQYPPEAGRARIEGTVVLMAVIGKDGRVQDVQVESGLPVLARAAIDAVKQ